MKQLCLRFDVDSHRCLREGVPALLDSLDAVHAPATFFVNMGRLTSRTRVARQYVTTGSRSAGAASKQTLPLGQKLGRRGLAVALVQNPRVGASTPGVVADAARRGHEIGLHGGRSHRLWQDDADGWGRAVVADEIAWGLAQLARAGVTAPAGFSSPGWTTSPTVAAVVREQGFAYLADGHAHGRAQPWRDEDGLVHLPTNVVVDATGTVTMAWQGYLPETMSYPNQLFLEAEDDHVVYQFTMQCKTKAGRDYINDYLFLVKLEDGKIARFQEYWDSKQAHDLLFG